MNRTSRMDNDQAALHWPQLVNQFPSWAAEIRHVLWGFDYRQPPLSPPLSPNGFPPIPTPSKFTVLGKGAFGCVIKVNPFSEPFSQI